MKNDNWNIEAKNARKWGSTVDAKALKSYRENFEKALDNTNGALADAFKSDKGKRASEFMGRETIMSLLDAADRAAGNGNQCVGLRTYYGLAYEELGDGKCDSKISAEPLCDEDLRPRLFIVAVDQNGKDIEMDMSQLKDPGGNSLGNGLPMPPFGNS